MKRANNLLRQITVLENLQLAFWKAGKGKRTASQVLEYTDNLDNNLQKLQAQIRTGLIDIGHYHYFKVYDPKERQICASSFQEQVLHHALMNVCHPCFERAQIFDSYASRPGKGLHAAVKRAAQFNRPGVWFLKLDIKQFFASIHHEVLKEQLRRLFKEPVLLDIFEKIIDSYEASPGCGMPIGNLTSQYFANHSLTGLDHFIKEKLKCAAYVRYMDDCVLWSKDKHLLLNHLQAIDGFVRSELKLNLKPFLLNACEKGLPFCGFIIFPYYIRLSQRSKKRYIRKMTLLDQQYKQGNWEASFCQRSAQSMVAFTQLADALAFRKNCLKKVEEGYGA